MDRIFPVGESDIQKTEPGRGGGVFLLARPCINLCTQTTIKYTITYYLLLCVVTRKILSKT